MVTFFLSVWGTRLNGKKITFLMIFLAILNFAIIEEIASEQSALHAFKCSITLKKHFRYLTEHFPFPLLLFHYIPYTHCYSILPSINGATVLCWAQTKLRSNLRINSPRLISNFCCFLDKLILRDKVKYKNMRKIREFMLKLKYSFLWK